ncbi:MAG TPA: hypothetical protein VFB81_17880 [Myxococcales bacterium]|nr:hypothetical protein [Myxococcales bacterium]
MADDGLPNISGSLQEMIRPLWDRLPPERRTAANLQDALDLAKEGWNLQVELGGDEGLEAELALRSEQFVARGLPANVARQLLQLLVERKRALFPDDDRLIAEARAREDEGELGMLVTWARYARVH